MKVLFLIVLTLFAAPVAADRPLDDPGLWFARMANAAQQVNYYGEVIHQHGEKTHAIEIARRAGPDGFAERILTLDGPPREVVRDGRTVTCILPDGRASLAGQRVPRNPFPGREWKYDDSLQAHYDFLDLGEARVAGRSCKVIGVRPRDEFRYGYRLWVDHATGLLVRSDLVDHQGSVIETVAFTRVAMPAVIEPARLARRLEGEELSWTVGHDRALEGVTASWSFAQVPVGFAFESARAKEAAVHQVFTDGLARVSVFVEPVRTDRKALAGSSRMGAVSAFGTVIDGHQITVVGEVPAVTVKSIGESFQPRR